VSAGLSRRAFIHRLGAATLLASCGGQVVTPSPTPRLRHIGYLSGNAQTSVDELSPPFRQRLRELGYVEGRDIVIDFRVADTVTDRLPSMAAELVNLPVDVVVAEAGPAQLAAKAATSTIPIVFVLTSDPVSLGLITSLAHPGGNITGVTTLSGALGGKRIEFLKEAVPDLKRVAILWNATQGTSMERGQVLPTQDAARVLGLESQGFGVRNPNELDAALEAIVQQRFAAVVMLPALSVSPQYERVPEFAAKHRLPQIYADVQMVRAGGLMHLGANYAAIHRRAADFVDKILKGAHPGDLPVEQPTEFDFIVNLPAAQRIGLTIPESVLRQATAVIR
jgi:putative ABC transport system substrate-binding protein